MKLNWKWVKSKFEVRSLNIKRVLKSGKSSTYYPVNILLLALICCFGSSFIFSHNVTIAQSPSPSPTYTPLPVTATQMLAGTTMLDATFGDLMNNRQIINASNVNRIQPFYHWHSHVESVTGLTFTPSGNLVSTSSNGTMQIPYMRMWQLQNSNIMPIESAFEETAASGLGVRQIHSSQNGHILVTTDGWSAKLWDAQTGREIAMIAQFEASSAVLISDSTLIIGGENGVVGFWSFMLPEQYSDTGFVPEDFKLITSNPQLMNALKFNEPIVQVDIDSTINQVFILTKSGIVHRYMLVDHLEGTAPAIPQEIESGPNTELSSSSIMMAVQTDRKRVIYAGSHQDIIAYDYGNNRSVTNYSVKDPVSCMVYNIYSKLLIVGDSGTDGVIHIFDLDSSNLVAEIKTGHALSACALNDDGTLLSTGDVDGNITLWGTN